MISDKAQLEQEIDRPLPPSMSTHFSSTEWLAAQAARRRWIRAGALMTAILGVLSALSVLTNVESAQSGGTKPELASSVALSPEIIARLATAATVQILALDARGNQVGQGTGFFVSRNGLIATNLHVISDAEALRIETSAGDRYENIDLITFDAQRDIALLRVPVDDALPIRLSSDSVVGVGQTVYVMGNPLGQVGTFSDGLVSAQRSIDGLQLVQITAPVSPGSSGGPVMNERGEVIGIATLMLRGGQNLNFAVPVRYLVPLLSTDDQPQRFAQRLLPTRTGASASIRASSSTEAQSQAPAEGDRGTDLVAILFVVADSLMHSFDGVPVGPVRRGSLTEGEEIDHGLTLTANTNYAIAGRCDVDCSDLDISVQTLDGTAVESDTEADDAPIVIFQVPRTGQYRLRVVMYSCMIEPCGYGVRLYRFPQ